MLESFELVPMPPPAAHDPQPDADLSIAAAALLASITASSFRDRQLEDSMKLVVTANVPLIDHAAGAVRHPGPVGSPELV